MLYSGIQSVFDHCSYLIVLLLLLCAVCFASLTNVFNNRFLFTQTFNLMTFLCFLILRKCMLIHWGVRFHLPVYFYQCWFACVCPGDGDDRAENVGCTVCNIHVWCFICQLLVIKHGIHLVSAGFTDWYLAKFIKMLLPFLRLLLVCSVYDGVCNKIFSFHLDRAPKGKSR